MLSYAIAEKILNIAQVRSAGNCVSSKFLVPRDSGAIRCSSLVRLVGECTSLSANGVLTWRYIQKPAPGVLMGKVFLNKVLWRLWRIHRISAISVGRRNAMQSTSDQNEGGQIFHVPPRTAGRWV